MNGKPRRLRLEVAGAVILLTLCVSLLAGAGAVTAQSADNLVRVQPSGVLIAPDGTAHVAVVDTPPPESTAVWAIDLVFDPNVITIDSRDCDSINTPRGAVGAFDCEVVDADKDGTKETVKILGAVLFTGTQTGLTQESVLADITLHATGEPGACTDLHLRIRSHADKDGQETGALVQDGKACIEGNAPAEGTESPNPVTPRTSEPTETPTLPGTTDGGTAPTGQNGQETGSPGETAPSGVSGTGTGSTVRTGGSGTTRPQGNGTGSEDGGGTSAVVWVLVGGAVLALAAGGAWAMVRLRSKPPANGAPPN